MTKCYYYDDAKKLIARIQFHDLGIPPPINILHAPLHTIHPLPSSASHVNCDLCLTKKGKTVAGAQECIDHRCKTCCTDTFYEAIAANHPRNPCKTQKLGSAKDNPPLDTFSSTQTIDAHHGINMKWVYKNI
jgi:hypothetical protein